MDMIAYPNIELINYDMETLSALLALCEGNSAVAEGLSVLMQMFDLFVVVNLKLSLK